MKIAVDFLGETPDEMASSSVDIIGKNSDNGVERSSVNLNRNSDDGIDGADDQKKSRALRSCMKLSHIFFYLWLQVDFNQPLIKEFWSSFISIRTIVL